MRITMLAIVVAAAGACGSHGMSMTHQTGEMDEHIAALDTETAAHLDAVAAGVDLSTALATEDGHFDRMVTHMDRMGDKMGDMAMCRDSEDRPPSMEEMAADLSNMRMECEAHRSTMGRAIDLPTAIGEERRHEAAMSGIFESMRGHMRTLSDHAGTFMCHMDTHMNGGGR